MQKKHRRNVTMGVAHVQATFNNTLITITDMHGKVLAWASAGTAGFKGARKSTPYAAQLAAEDVGKRMIENGMKTLEVRVCGPGAGRDQALRALQSSGFTVTSIKDVSPIAHNGCRPRKKRHP